MPAAASWELAVIGTALSDPAAMVEAEALQPYDFTGENQKVWAEILTLHANHALDIHALEMILNETKCVPNGTAFIAQALREKLDNVTEAVRQVEDTAVRKALKKVGALIAVEADNDEKTAAELIEYAEGKVIALRRNRGEGQPIGDIIAAFMPRLDSLRAGSFQPVWAPRTMVLRGMIPYAEATDLIVVGGRPGNGKSSFMRWEAEGLIRTGKKVVIFNYDNDPFDYARWFIAIDTGIDAARLKMPQSLTEPQMEMVRAAAARYSASPLVIDSARGDARAIYRRAQKYLLEGKLDFLMLDYIQQVSNGKENRNDDVAATLTVLRDINGQMRVPIMANSQLNREVERRGDGRPRMSDLRDSGALEQEPTVVLFPVNQWDEPTDAQMRMFRENINPHTGTVYPRPKCVPIQFHVVKNRNGEVGRSAPVKWNKSTNRYEPIETPHL